ncbi:minichromosome maintenance protein MCM [Ignisphaera sp. 4213-co]|uniref:DNA helicase n=1 Tax=Ignisphaera cupida TaxID=3050454 RepID=A0ABD4Z4P5_9CREN|nr:minichromosome maintenance protein MCM [Ignisphaera sp. 4213-co]MDK6028281.1 minichromosome maintenance protein MCM [Ignisphaera sp. 4213-co]
MSSETITAVVVDALQEIEEFIKNYKVDGRPKYRELVRRMILENRFDLEIDFNDIMSYNPKLAELLIRNPENTIKKFSKALRNVIEYEAPEYLEKIYEVIPRFKNLPFVYKIRDIRSDLVNKLIAVEGIVVRASPPKQKIVEAVYQHECGNEVVVPVTGDVVEKPVLCPYCHRSSGNWKLLEEKSRFRDFQRLVIQEKPEEMPAGRMPRSIDVDVYDNLVDVARPGDRVVVVGILKLRGSGSRRVKSLYDSYIEVNNIIVSQRMLEEIEITREDEEKIRELAKDPLIRRKIIASIAPAIYGLWDIKEAIALLLFGGVPKVLPDGTRIRGDIHVLMIGDPGTAKSQLLQYVSRIAPRAIYTTGKGATAAGLTAAVVRDKQTGEYYLEAGALVLADGGIACIDEIDKMREEDRVAIHEAMEQQTISIAKAGIVARLNARTSVLAAGNPRYGRYLINRSIAENVNLPPTILSRFDLIFVIRDVPNIERDSRLARHIAQVHAAEDITKPLIDADMVRKYIAYARKYVRPVLSEEAKKMLEEFFVEMRKKSLEVPDSPIAITARQFEALIRLAEAHAKMALKPIVGEEDAAEAIRLMKSMLESVGIDVESGEIDIDVIMTGKPKSQRDKMLIIENIIRTLAKEEGCAKIKTIIAKAKEQDIEDRLVEEVLTRMRREGLIYEARDGCYAPVM